jgi:catechol-2,3-dioxygenase
MDNSLRLDHVNMPARDPEGLARWYAATFGLQSRANRVWGPGLLMVFQPGEPVNRAPDLHLGLHVASQAALADWAARFHTHIETGAEFATFKVFDPEGNCVELYCPVDPREG